MTTYLISALSAPSAITPSPLNIASFSRLNKAHSPTNKPNATMASRAARRSWFGYANSVAWTGNPPTITRYGYARPAQTTHPEATHQRTRSGLQLEQDRVLAYQTLIEVAEKEHGLAIRKKASPHGSTAPTGAANESGLHLSTGRGSAVRAIIRPNSSSEKTSNLTST